jgi:2-phospho-L-lactate guanylyltransferase
MSIWAIIPVRPLEEGKSRLADALTPAERQNLNRTFFSQTLEVVGQAVGPDRILVVSRSKALLATAKAMGLHTLLETAPHGLNEALTQAATVAHTRGASAILSVSCDLPFLTAEDLKALLDTALEGDGLAIASDRAGTGTNALVMSPAGAIPYAYGPGSFAAHQQSAAAQRLVLNVVRRPGLSFDIDTPDDFEQMEEIKRDANPLRLRSCAFP